MYNISGTAKMPVRSRTSSALTVQQADQGVEHAGHSVAEYNVGHNLVPSVLVVYLEFLNVEHNIKLR